MKINEIYLKDYENELISINTKCGDKSYRIDMTNMYIHVYEIFENQDDVFVADLRLGCSTPHITTCNL